MLHRPACLDDAFALLRAGAIMPLSGGTDVFPALVDRPPSPALLDLTRLSELQGIAHTPQGWRIGAGTTWRQIERAALPPAFDMLKQAARQIGSVQIQNRATLGGNLCNASPAADGVPPLLALDARVELACEDGRRTLPLEEFLLGNRRTARREDELLVAVHVPDARDHARSTFLKLGARKYLVISVVMVAVALVVQEGRVCHARVAVGAASLVAQRLRRLEARLMGHDARTGFAEMVSADDLAPLAPIDDVRATSAYRIAAARELVIRALQDVSRAREAAHA